MRIGIISNAGYCTSLLQALVQYGVPASVFADAGFDPAGDIPLLSAFCSQFKIPMQTADPGMLYFWLEETSPDVVFIIGYRHLIDTKQLPGLLKDHIYNIHFGALPFYRGPNPVFWQIKNGEPHFTATIHRIDDKFDHGTVVWEKPVKRELYMNYGVAQAVLSQVVIEGVLYIIQQTLGNKPIQFLPQKSVSARYYKRPVLQDVTIDWNTMTAREIVNLTLACNPWNKGAFTTFEGQEIKILDAEIVGTVPDDQTVPGTILNNDYGLRISCRDKNILNISMFYAGGSFVPSRYAAVFGLLPGKQIG